MHARFHACLRLSWTSTRLAVGITPTTTAGFSKALGLPALLTEFTRRLVHLTTPFTEGCDGVNDQTLPPGRSNVLHFKSHCVQFSSVQVQFSSVQFRCGRDSFLPCVALQPHRVHGSRPRILEVAVVARPQGMRCVFCTRTSTRTHVQLWTATRP